MKKVVEIYNSNQSIKRFLDVSDDWVQPPSKYGLSFDTRFLTVLQENPPVHNNLLEKVIAATRIEDDNYIKYWTTIALTQKELDTNAAFAKESQSRLLFQDRPAIEALWFMLKMERKQRLGGVLTENEQTKYNNIAGKFQSMESL